LVDTIKGISGWTWSDDKGVNVSEKTKGTWDDWVAINKEAKRFRNKGWPFYDLLAPLMPQKAKGGNVFRAGTVPEEREKSQSPDWNHDEMDEDFAKGADNDDEEEGEGDSSSHAGDINDEVDHEKSTVRLLTMSFLNANNN
jgi:hypothetical protein